MHNLMFPWKQKSNLLSGEETELLKAEQDSFEWMFLRGETLCTKNGYLCAFYEIKREKNLKIRSFRFFFIILKQNNYIMMWKLGLHFVIINKFLKLRT